MRTLGFPEEHEDEGGRLWRRRRPRSGWHEEELTMVEVRNATLEADASVRTYFPRVPLELNTARAAVAWTFGLTAERYAPAHETWLRRRRPVAPSARRPPASMGAAPDGSEGEP